MVFLKQIPKPGPKYLAEEVCKPIPRDTSLIGYCWRQKWVPAGDERASLAHLARCRLPFSRSAASDMIPGRGGRRLPAETNGSGTEDHHQMLAQEGRDPESMRGRCAGALQLKGELTQQSK